MHGEDAVDLEFPDLGSLARTYLNLLFEAGPAAPGFSGENALSWQELRAWRLENGYRLAPEEQQLLRRLSQHYVGAGQKMKAHDAKSPHLQQLEAHHVAKQAAIKAAFDRMIRLNKKRP